MREKLISSFCTSKLELILTYLSSLALDVLRQLPQGEELLRRWLVWGTELAPEVAKTRRVQGWGPSLSPPWTPWAPEWETEPGWLSSFSEPTSSSPPLPWPTGWANQNRTRSREWSWGPLALAKPSWQTRTTPKPPSGRPGPGSGVTRSCWACWTSGQASGEVGCPRRDNRRTPRTLFESYQRWTEQRHVSSTLPRFGESERESKVIFFCFTVNVHYTYHYIEYSWFTKPRQRCKHILVRLRLLTTSKRAQKWGQGVATISQTESWQAGDHRGRSGMVGIVIVVASTSLFSFLLFF